MSDEVIYSDDCTMEILLESNWYPILCQSDFSFKLSQEVILKTSPNSGLFKEKTTRLSEGLASVSGLSPINNGAIISVFYLIQESVRTQEQTIRFKYFDQAGISKQILGVVVIVNTEIGATIGDFVQATVDMEFSGAVTIEDVTAPPSGTIQIYSDTWNTTPGQNWIDGYSNSNLFGYTIEGKTILEVDRDGSQYDFVGYASGTPVGNRQCKYNSSTHRLEFQNNFNSGETVFIIFDF
jgi:hypothetical protein